MGRMCCSELLVHHQRWLARWPYRSPAAIGFKSYRIDNDTMARLTIACWCVAITSHTNGIAYKYTSSTNCCQGQIVVICSYNQFAARLCPEFTLFPLTFIDIIAIIWGL